MTSAKVDVIIPVHNPNRPICRAVESALLKNNTSMRVLVIAHNTDLKGIRTALGDLASHSSVEIIHFSDGIASPAGPRNFALKRARAPYISFLDSDDTLHAGALDSWLNIAEQEGASVVIPRIEYEDTDTADPLPPTRPGRTRDLDPVRDRLAYRSAPLGLISRLEFPDLRYTPDLPSGEDLETSAALWFGGLNIAYDRNGPAYRVGAEADDRVTADARSLQEDFAFLKAFEESNWFSALSRSQRQALGVKIYRLHLFDAILSRLQSNGGLDAHRPAFAELFAQLNELFPSAIQLLSRRDRAVIDAVLDINCDANTMLELLEKRWLGGIDSLLTRNPLFMLHHQGPRKTMRAMIA
jgi:glycosyltransferase involved in cell wall biosynthesis